MPTPLRITTLIAFPALLLTLAGCGGDVRITRTATAPVEGVSAVHIVGEAGDLELIGEEGLAAVNASGTVIATTRALGDSVDFAVSQEGGVLTIALRTPTDTAFDAAIHIPADLPVTVDDASGDIVARGLSTLTITDDSGDIAVDDSGTVTVTDASGDMSIEDSIAVHVADDGDGDITIRNITGAVTIDADASGDITIASTGDVTITSDDSGDISVTDVLGNLTIGADGSGDVLYNAIAGTVTVP